MNRNRKAARASQAGAIPWYGRLANPAMRATSTTALQISFRGERSEERLLEAHGVEVHASRSGAA